MTKAQNPIPIGDLFSMTAGFSYDLDSTQYKAAIKEMMRNGNGYVLHRTVCLKQ
ncbi:MAG: hypothetical protein ACLT46_05685 [Hungatella sp.]